MEQKDEHEPLKINPKTKWEEGRKGASSPQRGMPALPSTGTALAEGPLALPRPTGTTAESSLREPAASRASSPAKLESRRWVLTMNPYRSRGNRRDALPAPTNRRRRARVWATCGWFGRGG
jgi:hypothetical protein